MTALPNILRHRHVGSAISLDSVTRLTASEARHARGLHHVRPATGRSIECFADPFIWSTQTILALRISDRDLSNTSPCRDVTPLEIQRVATADCSVRPRRNGFRHKFLGQRARQVLVTRARDTSDSCPRESRLRTEILTYQVIGYRGISRLRASQLLREVCGSSTIPRVEAILICGDLARQKAR